MKKIVIFDLDGCLSDDAPRLKFKPSDFVVNHDAYHDYNIRCGEDHALDIGRVVFKYFDSKPDKYQVVFSTARPESLRAITINWIRNCLNGERMALDYELYMRPNDNLDSSPVLKGRVASELMKLHGNGHSDCIAAAFDDRGDVIKMYKSMGIRAYLLDNTGTSWKTALEREYVPRVPTASDLANAFDAIPANSYDGVSAPTPDAPTIKPSRTDYAEVSENLRKMAATFDERNKVYGNSGIKVGAVMKALFPNGYACRTEADHRMMDHFNRVIAKLVRFVNSGMTHQDSIHDLAVYAAMCEAVCGEHEIEIAPLEHEE